MATYKRGGVYWYEFEVKGQRVRQSTKQGNNKVASNMESTHKARIVAQLAEQEAAKERLGCDEVLVCAECEEMFNAAKALKRDGHTFCGAKCAGLWGKARSMPTLQSFLDERFIPDAETRHKAKPATVRYYQQGTDMLNRSLLAGVRLDELTGEHAGRFAAEFARLSPSGINRGLRTFRRALNLAFQWGVIEKPVRVELAKGEVQRDRVLSTTELEKYLGACAQPWRDAATIIAEEGMRPGEVFALRWPHLFVGEDGSGLIRVVDGKSKAARRVLPMTPTVHALLKARHEAQGKVVDGWVFPSGSAEGHITQDTTQRQHKAALEASRVAAFVPYVLRHTALTRLGKLAGGDVFALAKIAGHSTIAVTQRYVHPEAETIDEIFARGALGTVSKAEEKKSPQNPPQPAKLLTAE